MNITKVERSWVMYDVANSVYATVMLAAIFPIFFTQVCGDKGDYWWGIGTSIATALVAILAPIIGAVADVKGNKKKFFVFFLLLGLVFTFFNAITDNWRLMLVGYIISHIGFLGSCLINDSFLTDITTPDRMDKISSLAYGLGYIGGSTIPFVICILLITFGENFGVDGTLAVKLSLCITVLWWGIFSIPFLKNVHQEYGLEKPKKGFVADTFKRIWITARKIFSDKKMVFFVIAYFFYIDGVNTVINMSTSYGTTLNLDATQMIIALLITQLVAFPCAIIFGRLSGKFGSLNMLLFAIAVYFIICLTGFFLGFGLEEGFLQMGHATIMFFILAVLVGLVQGGIQAISRSYFGKLVPPECSGEYFGFFDIFGKFAAVIGPALYALVKGITGRSSFAIFSIIILFLVGFIFLWIGKKYEKIA